MPVARYCALRGMGDPAAGRELRRAAGSPGGQWRGREPRRAVARGLPRQSDGGEPSRVAGSPGGR